MDDGELDTYTNGITRDGDGAREETGRRGLACFAAVTLDDAVGLCLELELDDVAGLGDSKFRLETEVALGSDDVGFRQDGRGGGEDESGNGTHVDGDKG